LKNPESAAHQKNLDSGKKNNGLSDQHQNAKGNRKMISPFTYLKEAGERAKELTWEEKMALIKNKEKI